MISRCREFIVKQRYCKTRGPTNFRRPQLPTKRCPHNRPSYEVPSSLVENTELTNSTLAYTQTRPTHPQAMVLRLLLVVRREYETGFVSTRPPKHILADNCSTLAGGVHTKRIDKSITPDLTFHGTFGRNAWKSWNDHQPGKVMNGVISLMTSTCQNLPRFQPP